MFVIDFRELIALATLPHLPLHVNLLLQRYFWIVTLQTTPAIDSNVNYNIHVTSLLLSDITFLILVKISNTIKSSIGVILTQDPQPGLAEKLRIYCYGGLVLLV